MPVSKHKHKKKQYQPQRGEKMYPESEIRRRVTEALDDYVTHCDGLMLLSLHDTLGLGVKRLEPVYAKMIEYFFNFRNAYVTMDGTYTVGDRTINIKGDNKTDMSMQIASQEGKNIDADIYISVRPTDIEKIIKSFGTKSFDAIVNNDIYGLTKGKLSSVSQAYSVYDIQSSRVEIQAEVFQILSETLADTYGVELVRLEIGTLILPTDIQEKIDQKTQAQNEVELAKLERERQNEVNQQIVDEQKAQSEKEQLQRQAEADAAAYEVTKAAEAQVAAQEAEVKIAELKVEQAKLEKEAELEKQKSFTDEYFRDKELDVQAEAVRAINSSVKTIITSGDGERYSGLIGIKEILDNVGE